MKDNTPVEKYRMKVRILEYNLFRCQANSKRSKL